MTIQQKKMETRMNLEDHMRLAPPGNRKKYFTNVIIFLMYVIYVVH